MRLSRDRLTVRWLMGSVAVVGLLLGAVDWLTLNLRASKYRLKAEAAARMERRFREMDAMDPVERARAAKEAEENFQEITHAMLADPVWTRKLIVHFAAMKARYEHAAENPRLPVPPDPPHP